MNTETNLSTTQESRLPEPVARRGIAEEVWRALNDSVFPGAKGQSICMAWDYCKARGLDPLKKVVHIVPMYVKDSKTGNKEWRDVVMPGIAEHRITAHRTGQYAGLSDPIFGNESDYKGVAAPEWCQVTVYRIVNGLRCAWTHKVFFREAVAENNDGKVNQTWTDRPYGQLEKCAEAGALRKAFPEETGGQPTAEEMAGRQIIDLPNDHIPSASQTAHDATLEKLGVLRASLNKHTNTADQEEAIDADEKGPEEAVSQT